MNMKIKALCIALLITVTAPWAPGANLESGFKDPPTEFRPRVWYDWLNGNINKAGVRKDLEDMKRVGIGGLQLRDVNPKYPNGPVRYGTDQWYDCLKYTIQTCSKLGLDFGMNNTPGWSGSGG